MLKFTLHKTDTDTQARRGSFTTAHGEVQTPVFMPVGTQGAVKGVSPWQLRDCGAQMMLSNTYHLHLRPGDERIASQGGLHSFTGWSRPILTDSGGFQVFSLADLNKVTDEGVEFKSHIDGKLVFLGPREAIRIQENFGSDIMMAFDECPPYGVTEDEARTSMERTIAWADVCMRSRTRDDLSLFLIGQGSFFPELRKECMQRLVAMDAPGYAIGGVSVKEPKELGREAVAWSVDWMPADKPRYLMGVGTPEDLLDYVGMGIDMFDCVMPTRNGRNGMAFTRLGPVKISNSQYADDQQPLDAECSCAVCNRFSRAFLRHLYRAKEMNGPAFLSLHNLQFYFDLMRDIRAAIETGQFLSFRSTWLDRYHSIL